ncbi:MAG: hypothetical protein L0Y55_10980, partial [Anaerolineales bacterium]|nr:hypothetical protein [Anaerolineales bacterium]
HRSLLRHPKLQAQHYRVFVAKNQDSNSKEKEMTKRVDILRAIILLVMLIAIVGCSAPAPEPTKASAPAPTQAAASAPTQAPQPAASESVLKMV